MLSITAFLLQLFYNDGFCGIHMSHLLYTVMQAMQMTVNVTLSPPQLLNKLRNYNDIKTTSSNFMWSLSQNIPLWRFLLFSSL